MFLIGTINALNINLCFELEILWFEYELLCLEY